MTQVVLMKFINDISDSPTAIITIISLFVLGIYKLSSAISMLKSHDQEIDIVRTLEKQLTALITKVELIYTHTNPVKLAQASSPISLTDEGRQVSIEIGAEEILKKYLNALIQVVELENPINAYDIQVVSMKVTKERMLSFLNEDEISIIKSAAFSKGLLIDDVMILFGVLLRNEMLKNRNIPIADVDKHMTLD